MATFSNRLIGAARLQPATYEEVEGDRRAFGQAFLVVLLSSVALSLGSFVRLGTLGFASAIVAGILGWFIWAGLTYLIGAHLLPAPGTRANWGELLRTTGFATAPGLIAVLGVIPALTGFISVIAQVWILIAFVIAVRQALDYASTWRAVAVCFIGWLIYAGTILALTA